MSMVSVIGVIRNWHTSALSISINEVACYRTVAGTPGGGTLNPLREGRGIHTPRDVTSNFTPKKYQWDTVSYIESRFGGLTCPSSQT